MSKEVIITDKAPKPVGPYSQGIKVGNLLFVSGQGPIDPQSGNFEGDTAAQTVQVFKNMEAILEAAGAGLKDVVKVSVFLQNINDFAVMNEVYKEFFAGLTPPTRTTVEAQMNGGIAVEMDCIAYIP